MGYGVGLGLRKKVRVRVRVGATMPTAPQPTAPVEEQYEACGAAPRPLGRQHVEGSA